LKVTVSPASALPKVYVICACGGYLVGFNLVCGCVHTCVSTCMRKGKRSQSYMYSVLVCQLDWLYLMISQVQIACCRLQTACIFPCLALLRMNDVDVTRISSCGRDENFIGVLDLRESPCLSRLGCLIHVSPFASHIRGAW